jgi:hypothetical protein
VPSLAHLAELLGREGRFAEAWALLDEALELCGGLESPYYSLAPNLLLAVLDGGVERAFLEVFEPHVGNDPWTRATVTAWQGDLLGATELLSARGGAVLAADLRVRAAGRLRAAGDVAAADEQLRRALEFFETVGATRRIREAGDLLAATA